MMTRLTFLATLMFGTLLATPACDQGNEGVRCNPYNSSSDCNGDLVCSQPMFCAEYYCCPTKVSPGDNAFCQPGCAGGAATVCAAANDAEAPACLFNACIADAGAPACVALATATPAATGGSSSGDASATRAEGGD